MNCPACHFKWTPCGNCDQPSMRGGTYCIACETAHRKDLVQGAREAAMRAEVFLAERQRELLELQGRE